METSLIRLVAAALIMCGSSAVLAQRPPRIFNRCDVIFPPVVLSQAYNPMSPDDYIQTFQTAMHRPADADTRGMIYSAVLLRHGNFRLPIELYVLDVEGGSSTGRVLYDRPGPPLGPELGNNGEIEARFDLGESTNRAVLAIQIPAGTEIDPGDVVLEFDVKFLCNHD